MLRTVVADDEPPVRKAMVAMLAGIGADVVGEAPDGSSLVQLVKSLCTNVDLAVVDVCMPGMSGLEACRLIRGLDPRIRLVLVSGCDAPNFTGDAIEIGVSGCLPKPVSQDALEAVLGAVGQQIARTREEETKEQRLSQQLQALKLLAEAACALALVSTHWRASLSLDGLAYLGVDNPPTRALVVDLGNSRNRFGTKAEPGRQAVQREVYESIRRALFLSPSGVRCALLAPLEPDQVLVLVRPPQGVDDTAQWAGQTARNIHDHVTWRTGASVAVGVGSDAADPSLLRRSYEEAAAAARSGWSVGPDGPTCAPQANQNGASNRPRQLEAAETWVRQLASPGPEHEQSPRSSVALAAVEFVNTNYSRELTLSEVAGHVHVSPFYLTRVLRRSTGQSFVKYLTTHWMERARQLLAETSLNVSDVARACGYADDSYFCKVFKRETGCRPTEFRAGVDRPGGVVHERQSLLRSSYPARVRSQP